MSRGFTRDQLLEFDDRPIVEWHPPNSGWELPVLLRAPDLAAAIVVGAAAASKDPKLQQSAQDAFIAASIVGDDGERILTDSEFLTFYDHLRPGYQLELLNKVMELSGLDGDEEADPNADPPEGTQTPP